MVVCILDLREAPLSLSAAAGPHSAKEFIMVEGSLNTPHYVLKQGNQPTRPTLVAIDPSDPTTQATVLFGFSDKPQYDTFHASCLPLELTPYPLVKRYLIDQLESEGQDLKLLALDATTPVDPLLNATTFQAALHALLNGLNSVPITHHLRFDDAISQYRIETAISTSPSAKL